MSVTLPRRAALAGAAALLAARPARAATAPAALTQVAAFDNQVTGVAVSKQGRIFVNFPRWEKDVTVSVAEVLKDGTLRAYPDAKWNAWTNLQPLDAASHFVCVQSVVVDPQDFLWVVDPAAPGNEFIRPGGPKLVKIDLSTDKPAAVIPLDLNAAPQGSYINDIRVHPDGRHAFLTDSGQRGAILVVDVQKGTTRRLLDGDERTQPEPKLVPHVDGRELRRPDNRIPAFGADGIALDPKGEYLYWQALVGRTLYRAPAEALIDASLSPDALEAKAEKVGTTHVADGLLMDRHGRLFVTDPENNAVRLRSPAGEMVIVAQDPRLRWPDSLAEGPDGAIYVTASHIQDMSQFHEKGATFNGPWPLFRFNPPAA